MLKLLKKNNGGFSLAEILIVIALLGILATVVLLNLGGSDVKAKEASLQSNLETLRTAVDLYRSDHGFYPGGTGDADNGSLTSQLFMDKLTQYTDGTGNTSTSKTTVFKYGPYLKEFPSEPFTSTTTVTIAATGESLLETIGTAMETSTSGTGGWYYEVGSGNIIANLGDGYPSEYAHF